MKRLWLLLLLLAYPVVADDYDAWHQKRLEKLTSSDGYLSLVGLEWVESEPRMIEGIGKAWVEGSQVKIDLEEGFFLEGKAVRSVTLDLSTPEGEQIVRKGTMSLYAIRRGARIGLRLKDSQAETRINFQGVERFEIDPDWRLEGRLIPEPRDLEVASVVGVSVPDVSPGWAEFEALGEKLRVRLIGKPNAKRFFLVFKDGTAGKSTYGACRFLYIDRVGESGLVLDFNKSINPACAFTHYATCPLPPKENVFSFDIPAGEKKP